MLLFKIQSVSKVYLLKIKNQEGVGTRTEVS